MPTMADAQSQFANSQFLPPTLAEQALEHALDQTPQASSLKLMLRECAQWRARVESALLIWEHKLTEIGLMSPELAAGCDEIRTKLKQNGYTVALVAEVSRGKSELINALPPPPALRCSRFA